MIREHDSVVLTRDMEEYGLKSGNVGVAVHCYPGGTAFEVEFMTTDGNTVAVLTLANTDIRPMSRAEENIQT